MSNIVAGIGRGQLEVLEERILARRENNKFYKEFLSNFDFISFQEEPQGHFSNYWLTTIQVSKNKQRITAEKIRIILEAENIETRPFWKPMHIQPVFLKYPAYLNGISESLFNEGVCLPSGSNLSDDEKARIASCMKRIFS